MKRLVPLLLLTLPLATVSSSVCLARSTVEHQVTQVNAIGTARMENDGTIVLQLRAEGAGGVVGDALLRYPPSHLEYSKILQHVGGIKPGEEKPVPPWPGKK